jgi:hypothetical protein
MFDWFTHWFAKTEIINNGTQQRTKTPFQKGHYSFDLTFLVVLAILFALFMIYKKFMKSKKTKYMNQIPMHNMPFIGNNPHP